MPTLTVTTNANAGAGSLRAQIAAAASGDTIVFDAALAGQTITLTTGAITIAKALTVQGLGANLLTINGGGGLSFRVQDAGTVAPHAVTISGMTVTGGGALSDFAIASGDEALTLDGVLVTGNGRNALQAMGGSLTVTNSTLSDNAATGTHGVAIQAQSATVSISNTTVTGNTGAPGVQGGAFLFNDGTISISNSTIVGNTASTGAVSASGGAITVTNSIIAGNTALGGGTPDFNFQPGFIPAPPGSATLSFTLLGTSAGANFIDGGGNILNAAANLGALQNNGGTVPTMLPNAGSPAINAGAPAFAPPPATDERGLARISGGRIDLGAVEVQQAAAVAGPPASGGVDASPPAPPPSKAPAVNADFSHLTRYLTYGANPPLPATVVTPEGKEVSNPFLAQQRVIAGLIAKVDAGSMTLGAARDLIVDLADGTTSVATLTYQFFTGQIPTKAGLDYLVSSPENPRDLNDGFYAGMSLENRYINFAVNLGKAGEGRAAFNAGYGALSLSDATAKAYAEIFGKPADAAKLAALLNDKVEFAGHTGTRAEYLASLGGDPLGAKAAMVGFLLAEAAKSDAGPYAVMNENFLYDLADGVAAYGTDLHIYLNAGPMKAGLVGVADTTAQP